MSTPRILVVDDETIARSALRSILAQEGYEVGEAANGENALADLEAFDPDVVLSDVRMPRMDGLTLLKKARERGHRAAFVFMSGAAQLESAVEAMRAGAENYLAKPLNVGALMTALHQALERRAILRDTDGMGERLHESTIVGSSPELQEVLEMVRAAASSMATVLVLGESGTGKDLIAHAVHLASPRRDRPFVKVSCAALSETLLDSELFGHERGAFPGALSRREGHFELADHGTIFLDEIGEISPASQVKLLHVLQRHELERLGGTHSIKVDVRVVAATQRDLVADVKAGRFREDLFYRLNVVMVTLPPLRQRKSDIPLLVNHFIEKYARAYDKKVQGIAPAALPTLVAHSWPGNVRELENVIERAVVLCKTTELGVADLPPLGRTAAVAPSPVAAPTPGPATPLYELERQAILRALETTHGSTSRAAEMLGISVRKIQYRLKEYAAEAQQASAPPPQPQMVR